MKDLSSEDKRIAMDKLMGESTKKEEEAIKEAMEEERFKEKILTLVEESRGKSELSFPRTLANQFLETPAPYDLLLPEGYFLWQKGVYKVAETEEITETICITETPFFVACKDETGKVLLLKYLNNTWYKEWMQAKKIATPSSLLDALIFPSKGVKTKILCEYAMECAAKAPFAKATDPAMMMILEDIKKEYELNDEAEYPVLVSASKIKGQCQDYGVAYNELRNYLIKTGSLRQDSKVERDKETKKPSRFLVFDAPIKEIASLDGGEK